MKQAKMVFVTAGVYGAVTLVPMFFAEQFVNRSHDGTISQFYYAFLSVGLAWQLAFIQIGRDPIRLNPVMPLAICEKAFYLCAMAFLLLSGRLHIIREMWPGTAFLLFMDAVWGGLFVFCFLRTRTSNQAGSMRKAS